jgi:hypothetical protein
VGRTSVEAVGEDPAAVGEVRGVDPTTVSEMHGVDPTAVGERARAACTRRRLARCAAWTR